MVERPVLSLLGNVTYVTDIRQAEQCCQRIMLDFDHSRPLSNRLLLTDETLRHKGGVYLFNPHWLSTSDNQSASSILNF